MAVLKAEKRAGLGTHKTRALRAQGVTPCIIYGHGLDPVAVSVNTHDLGTALEHGERLLELEMGSEKENVLIKDVQFDPFGQKILHADLARVDLNERVTVTVPIVLTGTPAGATEGGVLQQTVAEARIECVVVAIPEDIRVRVNEMKIGDTLHMRDLKLPEGATLQEDPEMVVASVVVIAEEVAAPATGEEAVEPEVLTAKVEPEEAPEAGKKDKKE
ncbi:MAG: 50S ribosomal protein L25 [Planctomycetota bacterium]|nr:50S ribosomal protein L25 [Planctomycetota bacterium]